MPEFIPGATEFTEDDSFGNPAFVLEAMKQFPDVFSALRRETDLNARLGRKRMEGDWSMIMVAFVLSKIVDVEPFYTDHLDSRIWQLAGFRRVPSKQTVWLRLTELEAHADAFTRAANLLIQKAINFDPEIVENVWVDATGFETHAVLEHCCKEKDACREAGGKPATIATRATEELIKEERHKEAVDPPTPGVKAAGAAEEIPAATAPKKKSPKGQDYKYFRIRGHEYRSLDHTSGARSYTPKAGRKKTWFGGYSQVAVSMRVGAPLAINIFKASDQEHAHYKELFAGLDEATGGIKPKNMVLDRGYSVERLRVQHAQRHRLGHPLPQAW